MDTKLSKPAAKTSKLCSHALSGGCHFGAQCAQEHPLDVDAAKVEQASKKTLNLCGYFASPSGCTKPGCTFLHVALAPKAAPKATASGPSPSLVAMLPKSGARPGRQAPTGATPSRPAQKGAPRDRKDQRGPPRERRGGKGPSEPRREREERKEVEPEVFRDLHRTRGKINSIRKVADSFRTLHAQLPGGGFLEKAEAAEAMLAEITEKVKLFNSGIDQYLIELGQKVEDDDASVDAEPDDVSGELDDDVEPDPDADGATALLASGDHL
jgi:hypothetical protein